MMPTEKAIEIGRELAERWTFHLETRQPEPNRLDVLLTSPDDLVPFAVALRVQRIGYLTAVTGLDPGPESGMLELLYHFCQGAAVITLRLQVPQPFFHVEFYDPLPTSSPDRSYTYVWLGDLMVDRLRVSLQQPAGASGFSMRPEAGAGSSGPDGLLYRTVDLGAAAAGKQLPFEIRYTKTDARTSADILGLKAPDATPAAITGASKALPDWLLALAIYSGVIGAAGLAGTLWWRRRTKVLETQSGGGKFCTRCGNRLAAGRFCSACGAPISGN